MPPLHAAGTDPSHIPGLIVPRPGGAEEEAQEPAVEPPGDDARDTQREEAEREEDETEETAEKAEKAETDGEDPGGPAFEVSDRRGTITADRAGVRFRLDGETAEFGWDEIGAVEMDTPRFGRRFTVTVHTTGRRTYEADVEAPTRSLPKRWAAELDAVLDAYFDETGS